MINIKRGVCPLSLSPGTKIKKLDYKNQDVKDEMLKMQRFKCCWCEKDMRKLGERDKWVEHIEPKKSELFKYADGRINYNKANSWGNLLYACGTCNSMKGTTPMFHPISNKRQLIDPSNTRINPENHITFKGDGFLITYKERKKSKIGKTMINELQLKRRTDLYALIRDRILEINKSFSDLYTAVENNDILKYQRTGNELERATCASVSHASFMRYYIKKELNKFNAIDLQKLNGIYNRNFVPIIINIAKKAELRA